MYIYCLFNLQKPNIFLDKLSSRIHKNYFSKFLFKKKLFSSSFSVTLKRYEPIIIFKYYFQETNKKVSIEPCVLV